MRLLYYYLDELGVQQGPLTAAQLRLLIEHRAVGPMTPLRTDRMENFDHAYKLPGAFPDYDPSGQVPAIRTKRWGYRALAALVSDPMRVVALLAMVGLAAQFYRAQDSAWIFAPNKLPAPVLKSSQEQLLEALAKDNTEASYHDDLSADSPLLETSSESAATTSATPPDGNSLPGRVQRGLLGPPRFIAPSQTFSLPKDYPAGLFYFNDPGQVWIYSELSHGYNFNPRGWRLGAMLNRVSNVRAHKHPICRVGGYAQANNGQLSEFFGQVGQYLLDGTLEEWGEFSQREAGASFELHDGIRVVAGATEPTGLQAAIAVTGRYPDKLIAVSDLALPDSAGLKKRIQQAQQAAFGDPFAPYKKLKDVRGPEFRGDNPAMRHRLRVLTWPGGKTKTQRFSQRVPEDLAASGGASRGSSGWPYTELVFSPDGEYLVGRSRTGEVVVHDADDLRVLFRPDGVHTGGPYDSGSAAPHLATPRISFSPNGNYLLVTDRGLPTLVDIRTREVTRLGVPSPVQTSAFNPFGDVVAASCETGEVYQIDTDTKKLVTKAVLAGLGPLTAYVNFSVDGGSLSAVFDENTRFGMPGERVRLAMFWDLKYLREPSDSFEAEQAWSCVPSRQAEHPGARGRFIAIVGRPSAYEVAVLDRADQLRRFPLAALDTRSQRRAVLLHAVVEAPTKKLTRLSLYDDLSYEPR